MVAKISGPPGDGGAASVREAKAHVCVGIKGIELLMTVEEARAFVKLINQIIIRVEQRAKLDANSTPEADKSITPNPLAG